MAMEITTCQTLGRGLGLASNGDGYKAKEARLSQVGAGPEETRAKKGRSGKGWLPLCPLVHPFAMKSTRTAAPSSAALSPAAPSFTALSPDELYFVDQQRMKKALSWAARAAEMGEVPVGALHYNQTGELIAKGLNLRENLTTPLGHAEVICLHRAAKKLQTWRLLGCTLYVTMEPCIMCSGLIIQSRLQKVVFGAYDPKGGGLASLYQIGNDPRLNHQIEMVGGVLEAECSKILSDFFKKRRSENAQKRKTQRS